VNQTGADLSRDKASSFFAEFVLTYNEIMSSGSEM